MQRNNGDMIIQHTSVLKAQPRQRISNVCQLPSVYTGSEIKVKGNKKKLRFMRGKLKDRRKN